MKEDKTKQAVALQYNPGDEAPIIVAAGKGALADKIMFLGSSIPLLGNIPMLIFNFIMEGIISSINVFGRMKGLNTKTVLSGKIKTVSLALTLISGYLVYFFEMSASILNLLIGLILR